MPRVALVTGGNKGIGLATVRALANTFDGDVFLTARDSKRGMAAVADLMAEGCKVNFHQLDLDDAASAEKLKDFLVDRYGGVDVLVNNAGIAFKNDATEPMSEQAEVTLRTNYFNTKRLWEILSPALRPGARIVNVSSCCGLLSTMPDGAIKEKLAKSGKGLTVRQT